MQGSKPVYVVDDDTIIRCSLSAILRNAGYHPRPFANGDDFLESCAYLPIGCVLLDMHMPAIDGLEVQQHVCTARPDLPVLFMSADSDIPIAVEAMRHGAVDFIEKPFADATLLSLLDRIYADLPEQAERAQAQAGALAAIASLSKREHEVVAGLVAGLPNKLIAAALGIGIRTVETYRANAVQKLGVRGVGEIVQLALEAGVEPLGWPPRSDDVNKV